MGVPSRRLERSKLRLLIEGRNMYFRGVVEAACLRVWVERVKSAELTGIPSRETRERDEKIQAWHAQRYHVRAVVYESDSGFCLGRDTW